MESKTLGFVKDKEYVDAVSTRGVNLRKMREAYGNSDIIKLDGLVMNYLEQTVFYNDNEILLTNREFQVLYFLMRHQGQVFSKAQIYNQATGDGEKDSLNTIEITISGIRKKRG